MTRSDAAPDGEPRGATDPWADARARLDALERAALLRRTRHADSPPGPVTLLDGRTLHNFSSNNYLDLAAHPRVTSAAAAAAAASGAGAGGSRLITGSLRVHAELEAALADLKGAEDALVFSSGYAANLGVLQALGERADGSRVPVFFDRLSHACIVDAVRLAGVPWRTFAHNDTARLERLLRGLPATGDGSPAAIVATEGVFSMDGDTAPLAAIMRLCERHDALLLLDDAHGTGTTGADGRGSAHAAGIAGHPRLVHMGTLSKALGSQGGFVAGPRVLREILVNRARTFVFDTALAPPAAAAALEALRVMRDEPERVAALRRNAERLRARLRDGGIGVPESPSPIVPVVLGGADHTLAESARLLDAGFLVVAIRPPTVPRGTSRLRITLGAGHTTDTVDALAEEILRGRRG